MPFPQVLPEARRLLHLLFVLLFSFAALGVVLYGGKINTDPDSKYSHALKHTAYAQANYYDFNFNDMPSGILSSYCTTDVGLFVEKCISDSFLIRYCCKFVRALVRGGGVLKYWIPCGGLGPPPFFRNCFGGGGGGYDGFGCTDANPPLPYSPSSLLVVSSVEFCAKCYCMMSSCLVHIITIYCLHRGVFLFWGGLFTCYAPPPFFPNAPPGGGGLRMVSNFREPPPSWPSYSFRTV